MNIKTKHGEFRQDPSGLFHYQFLDVSGYVRDVAGDAIAYRPTGPAWFWFNGTFAPMEPNDTAELLYIRWDEWRNSYHSNPKSLRELLEQLAGTRSDRLTRLKAETKAV